METYFIGSGQIFHLIWFSSVDADNSVLITHQIFLQILAQTETAPALVLTEPEEDGTEVVNVCRECVGWWEEF